MKIIPLTWSLVGLGLTVNLAIAATGEEGIARKNLLDPSALSATSPLLAETVNPSTKTLVDPSLVRVTTDQPVPTSKKSPPLYQPPRRGAPGGRVGGGTRGPSEGMPLLYALVPDHVAITAVSQPSLVWYLSKGTTFPLEFTVVEGLGVEPLLEVALPSPKEAGIHMISLAQYDVQFEPGKTYQWFVSLIPDPARRSKDIIAGGMLEVESLPENIAEAVKQATPDDATKLLAGAGFWYDAMGLISEGIQVNPTNRVLHDVRAALLEEVDLNTVALVDRSTGL